MLGIILLASIIGSVCALVGGVLLLWRENFARRISLTLLSFATGSLIGAAFLELLPEAIHEASYESVAPFVIGGILLFFLFEKLLKWYHCHDNETCDYHAFSSTVIFGDAFHNLLDGIVIALSFSVSIELGIATTVAIFFHEVPQEIGDFGVLLHAGYSRRKVFTYNFLAALATPLGALIGYLLLPTISPFIPFLLAFTAGTFIYIAVSDLLPELRHQAKGGDWGHLLALVLGILVVAAVGILFHEGG